MAVFVAAGIAMLFGSKTMRTLNTAMPPAWLIGVQTYRVAGAMFLWPFLAADAVPAGFAWPAGVGDTLPGLAAPFVALGLPPHRPGARPLGLAGDWVGVFYLILPPTAARLVPATNNRRFAPRHCPV